MMIYLTEIIIKKLEVNKVLIEVWFKEYMYIYENIIEFIYL